MFARTALAATFAAALFGCATTRPAALPDPVPAQRAWAAACEGKDGWDTPGPPFRIYGSTYYVGTCGITALLLDRPDGLVLVDSGTDKGAEVVLANLRTLGFDPRNVRAILMSHEHFDHIGGMARLQAATGAPVYASGPAAEVLRTGLPRADDPQARSGHPAFPPVTGQVIALDGAKPGVGGKSGLQAIATPGHTIGATSWTWRECERAACKTIVYADSMNPISSDGYRFSSHPALVAAFREGIAAIAGTPCDILLAPHPGAAALSARTSGAQPLSDPAGCRNYAAAVSDRLDKRLAQEAAGG